MSPDSSAPLTRLLACSPLPRAENKKNILRPCQIFCLFFCSSRKASGSFFLLPPVVVLFECVGLSPAPGYTSRFTAFVFLSLKLQSLRRPSLLIGRVKSLQLLQKKVRVAKMMFSPWKKQAVFCDSFSNESARAAAAAALASTRSRKKSSSSDAGLAVGGRGGGVASSSGFRPQGQETDE